jgi:hypothetical protein
MIMRGLLDAYLYSGNQQALQVVTGMADWAHSRLTKLPRSTLDGMWQIYIGGEYNAMPEVLADLAAITGKTEYLATAEAFVNTYLFDVAVAKQDTLNGEHANQHIPQYRSYLAMYDNFSDKVQPSYRGPASNYYAAAANFWDMVVPHRMYFDGGTAGSGEFFGARDVIAATIGASNAETCTTYNMLKLSRLLFFHTAGSKYMQFYERALIGTYLADRSPNNSNTNPNVVYFLKCQSGHAAQFRQPGNLRRRNSPRGTRQVPGLDLFQFGRRLDPLREPLHRLQPDVGREGDRRRTVHQLPGRPHRRNEPHGYRQCDVHSEVAGSVLGAKRLHGPRQWRRSEPGRNTGHIRVDQPELAHRRHRRDLHAVHRARRRRPRPAANPGPGVRPGAAGHA